MKKLRENSKAQKGCFILLTGLSGSGKSTLAEGLERALIQSNRHTFHLDGDVLRMGLTKDLGFSPEDRKENLRRVAEVGHLFVEAGIVCIASFIAPYASDRENLRQIIGDDSFIEIYVSTPLDTCELRDVKGLYKKARTGEISHFTGISAPYEAPLHPNYTIDTSSESIEQSVASLHTFLNQSPWLKLEQ